MEEKLKIFKEIIDDIINNPQTKELLNFKQHKNTSRYVHCLNVAFISFLICYKFNFKFREAARAGFLHDYFFYDWHTIHKEIKEKKQKYNHCFAHGETSFYNASQVFDINKIEKDIIINHMFPLVKHIPTHKEVFIIALIDKYCTIKEFFNLKNKISHEKFNLLTF